MTRLIARSIPVWFAFVALAGCGDNNRAAPVVVDAMPDGANVVMTHPVACKAMFSDNFAETWDGATDCATVDASTGDTVLGLSIPSQTLGVPFAISLDLGPAPGPGTYSSETLATPWSVSALKEFDLTSCLYQAGTASVPPGTFTLTLDAIGDQAHGTLDLGLYVLSRPYTYCGETSTEHLRVTF